MNIKQLGQKIHWWWLNHRYFFRHQIDGKEQLRFDSQYWEHSEWLQSAWGLEYSEWLQSVIDDFDFDEDDLEDDFECLEVYKLLS